MRVMTESDIFDVTDLKTLGFHLQFTALVFLRFRFHLLLWLHNSIITPSITEEETLSISDDILNHRGTRSSRRPITVRD